MRESLKYDYWNQKIRQEHPVSVAFWHCSTWFSKNHSNVIKQENEREGLHIFRKEVKWFTPWITGASKYSL